MARLPTVGGDDGNWGEVLNTFLGVAHNTDGTIKQSSISGLLLTEGDAWQANTAYTAGTVVTYSGSRYLTPSGAAASSSFDLSKWVLLGVAPDSF